MVTGAKWLRSAVLVSFLFCLASAFGVTAMAQALPPVLNKTFGAVAIPIGGSTTLSFLIGNNVAGGIALTGINFTDTLPAGLRVASPNGLAGSCVPIAAIIAAPGSGAVSLSGLALDAGRSCYFSVNVVGVAEGHQQNVTSAVGSNEGGAGAAALASIFVGTAFQGSYAANLDAGESYINLSNNGVNGASFWGPGFGGPVGNICVNVYAFSPDEQLVSCCSCLVTPNGIANLGVTRDLTSNTLTPARPSSVTIKLMTTLAGSDGTGTNCSNSAAMVAPAGIAGGTVAWRTTLHRTPSGLAVTEAAFSPAVLSSQELASLSRRCAFILGNGSGYGVCRSCRAGALGAGVL